MSSMENTILQNPSESEGLKSQDKPEEAKKKKTSKTGLIVNIIQNILEIAIDVINAIS